MRRLLCCALLLAASAPLGATDLDLPPGRWWEEPVVIERVGLSEEQRTEIRALVYEHARQMIDLNAGLKRAELDLKQTVDRTEIDPQAVRTAFAAFQDARRRLETERFEMLLGVRLLLSDEQWEEIQELRRRFHDRVENRRDRPPQRPRRPGPDRPGGR